MAIRSDLPQFSRDPGRRRGAGGAQRAERPHTLTGTLTGLIVLLLFDYY